MIPKNPKLTEEVAAGVAAVIAGTIPEFDSEDSVTPHAIRTHMEALGWDEGELDQNGWQYDWWLHFAKDGKKFTASGSGYYGGFHFAPTED